MGALTPQLRPPTRRHFITKVTQKTLVRPRNTVIEPWVDVVSDVAAINAGRARRVGENFVINDRIYGVHNNTVFPISGPGFHQLDRGAFKALGVYNKFGDTTRAAEILDKMSIGSAQRKAGLKAWKRGIGG